MSKERHKKVRANNDSKVFNSTLSSKSQITVPVVESIKKDALLSLYGSMPPKGAATQKDWTEIREKARSEVFH